MTFVFLFLCLPFCVFSQESVTFQLKEGIPIGTDVGSVPDAFQISANMTKDQFNALQYKILNHPHKHLFSLNENSGLIRTAKKIDREEICKIQPLCSLELSVSVSSTPFQVFTIKIEVEDLNDNSPQFDPATLRLSVSEYDKLGTPYKIHSATDKDVGRNAIQAYQIQPKNGPFGLNVTKTLDGSFVVKVVLTEAVDREIQSYYRFSILAFDGGSPPYFGSLTVDVDIEDENDNPPVFSQNSYNISVQENVTVDTTVLQFVAHDRDVGDNGRISYHFSPRSDLDAVKAAFSLDSQTGNLNVISALNYGVNKFYEFFVEAADQGQEPQVTQVKVIINVLDAGNNPPILDMTFLEKQYDKQSVNVSEGTKENTAIAHIRVSDSDPGENGKVTCSVKDVSFGLQEVGNNQGYVVIVKSDLDRETHPTHSIRVTCSDNGQPALTSSLQFTVHVTDDNDNTPKFDLGMYHASVKENKPSGTFVTDVHAQDKDEGQNARIRYFLNGSYNLVIDDRTGVIKTSVPLDRETNPQLSVTILAVDGGNPPLTGTVMLVIDIEDENDNPPRFNVNQFYFDVEENVNNSKVGILTAMDLDEGQNGNVTFSLVDTSNVPFIVNPNGAIFTTMPLNREETEKYRFTIQATDHGTPSKYNSIDVNVIVRDANDNTPKIIFPNDTNNTVSIPYLSEIGALITTIKAYDNDAGKNAQLVFKIRSGNGHETFKLDANSGELFYDNTFLVREDSVFQLEIVVSDQGNPIRSQSTTLNIILTHTNVTLTSLPQEESGNKYIIISVIVVVFTIFVSAVILVIIFLLRRTDKKAAREKLYHDKVHSANQFQDIEKRYYQNGTVPLQNEDLSRKKKKEVSFSLDEELDITSVSHSDDQHFDGTFPNGPDHEKLKHLQFSQFLINPGTHITSDPRQRNVVMKGSHDSSSDTSTDLTTSDSGRGGSDMDVHQTANIPDDDKHLNNYKQYTRSPSYPPTLYRGNNSQQNSDKGSNSSNRALTPTNIHNKKDYTGLTPRETFERKHGLSVRLNQTEAVRPKSEGCLPSYV